MKKIYTIFSIILICLNGSAQFKLAPVYSMSVPQGEMNDNIGLLHSINLSGQYTIPGTSGRLVVGAETGIGMYATVVKQQDLRFPDGSGINTAVTYSSNVFNGGLFTRVNVLKDKLWSPYASLKGGYAQFFSNVTVEDPDDPSECRALERKNIIKDHSFFVGYGGGVQIDIKAFSRNEEEGKYIIDISVNKIRGGSLNYINTKNIQSHTHTDPNSPPPPSGGKSEPLNIHFININTQTIHEHQVAELYNSPLRMLDIRIGLLFTL